MSQDATRAEASEPAAVSTEALRKAESYIEAEEGATNRLTGWAGRVATAIRAGPH
jgi:hypothetical protein